MKESALEARGGELMLFEDMHALLIVCLFCGDSGEHRFMCRKCRLKSLFEIFWKN